MSQACQSPARDTGREPVPQGSRDFVLCLDLAARAAQAEAGRPSRRQFGRAVGYVVRPGRDKEIVDAGSPAGLAQLRSHRDSAEASAPNGSFACAFVDDGAPAVTLMTDPIGTIPLYCATDGRRLACGTDWLEVARLAGKRDLSIAGLAQLMLFGYALGETTTVDGLWELPPGAIVRFCWDARAGRIQRTERRYWAHVQKETCSREDEFESGLLAVWDSLKARFGRYIAKLGTQPLLRLSGGADSRFLLEMFRDLPGLITITYGESFSNDVIVAESLARQAGLPHHRCELSGREAMDRTCVEHMVRCTGARSVPFLGMGSLGMLRFLPEREYIHLPGHAGDMIAGGWIKPPQLTLTSCEQARDAALTVHAMPLRHGAARSPRELSPLFADPDLAIGPVDAFLRGHEDDQWWKGLHRFNMEGRQRRYILSDSCVNRRNGPVLLPFWDMEIVDFFSRCALPLLFRKRAYYEFVSRHCVVSDVSGRVAWSVNSLPKKTVLREGWVTRRPWRGVYLVLRNRIQRRLSARFPRYRAEWRYLAGYPASEVDSRLAALMRDEPLLEAVLTPAGRRAYKAHLKWHLLDVLQVMERVRGLLRSREA
jgi:hypothetical protein